MPKSRAQSFFSKPSTWLALLFIGILIWFVTLLVKAVGAIEQDYVGGLNATEQFAGNLKSSLPSWLGGDSSGSSDSGSTSHWYNPFSWFGSSSSSSDSSSADDNSDTSTN